MRYGFVIDQTKCIGCHACTVACKTEHDVPLGVNRTWVKYVEKGVWPDTNRFFSIMRCNHCTDAPCVSICPTTALFRRDDGIVDFDTSRCIGCKACMQACPYDALYIDPDDNTAQKCNYCVHRVEVGIEPACVVVCPVEAIIAGDLDNPANQIAKMVATEQLTQRSLEQGTKPNLWYKGADEASLDPLAASSMSGSGIWRDTEPGTSWMTVDLTPKANGQSRGPATTAYSESAPPRVTYNTDHPAPWGWRVSSYFLTKGIAAGLVLALAVASLLGANLETSWARWGTPLVAGLFLALTGYLLVADLQRPDRFYFLLTKGNPRSWLVRGSWILAAYAAVLGVWFLAGLAKADGLVQIMMWIGVPVALATAGYTAFLFGQAEARDLWQSPMLLWHMIAAAFAAGGAAAVVFSTVVYGLTDPPSVVSLQSTYSPDGFEAFVWTMIFGAAALLLIALAEMTSHHPTRNIEAAMHHMTRGHFAREWWVGGQLVGVVVPIILGLIGLSSGQDLVAILGGLGAMAGLWFADDALVRAGQAVPLS